MVKISKVERGGLAKGVSGLFEGGLTPEDVATRLRRDGIHKSQPPVSRILNSVGIGHESEAKGLPSPVKVQPPGVTG